MDEIEIKQSRQGNLKVRKIIYYLTGILEILLACRFILKLFGASSQSAFVSIIYSVTQVFVWPFNGIFNTAVTKGIETQSVFEPGTIIAMIVYALIAYGIVKLIKIYKTPKADEIQ